MDMPRDYTPSVPLFQALFSYVPFLSVSNAKAPDISFIEQQFLIALGTKVTLKGSLEKGTIQIDYFSRQDLDRLYEIFVKEK